MLEMVDRVSGNMGYIGTEPGRLYRMGPRIKTAVTSGMPPLTLERCKEKPLKGLTIYGKSEQATITGAQLFDKSSCIEECVIEIDGTEKAANGYGTTDFIPLDIGKYTITKTGSLRCKVYDKDKKPLTTNTYTDFNISNGGTFEIKENIKYIRFSFTTPSKDTIMLNSGDMALPYEP